MKILHTSDWHLGKKLCGRSRYEESAAFLDWLLETIEQEKADALLVSGDIFDTVSPSNRALEQYYGFLYRVSASCCKTVIITAGNHDSPSLLNAPKDLLKMLNVHVVANASENPEEEIVVIKNALGSPEALVCAVPYLREKDIRTVSEGESPSEKSVKMLEGVREHYAQVFSCAEKICRKYPEKKLFVIAMGHLFAAGGVTVLGDGVREIYVGSLERIGADIFPEIADYVALGHLHVPQKIAGCQNKRYSGSPLPIGFSEAKQRKIVISADFDSDKTEIKDIAIPVFRRLETIKGDLNDIREKIASLKFSGGEIWAEVVYTGAEVHADLQERIFELSRDSSVDILKIRNESLASGILSAGFDGESLDSLNECDVFERCLESSKVPHEQRAELFETFKEALILLHEEDLSAT